MKRVFLFSVLISFAIPASAQVDPEIHKLCSDVADYSGCVNTQMLLTNKRDLKSTRGDKPQTSVQSGWEEHVSKNPSLKAWADANPDLAEKKRKEWELSSGSSRISNEFSPKESKYCRWNPWDKNCASNPLYVGVEPPIEDKRSASRGIQCPPGKKLYQMEYLGGLIKGKEACLTDYERMSLDNEHRRQWGDAMQGIQDGINSFPR